MVLQSLEMCDRSAMYITNVEKEGPFLKVWGQVDKKSAIDVERALYKAYVMYQDGKYSLNPGNLLIGVLCCAKYIDEKYYRARITNVDTRCQGTVEVNFIDYGNRDLVPIANLRSMDCFQATFITLPPLAIPFILSEAVCVGGEWNDISLEQISREIRYMEVKYTITSTHLGYQIISIYIFETDLALHLVQNNLMQSIPLETQESLLSTMIPRTPQVMPPPDQSLLQYKSVTLEPNNQYEVYVSYITDGPCHFSVQLKKSETTLGQLMREINSIPLKPFEELPIPGTVCLAKCVEDSHICRAVITSEVDNQYKLFYVDFGNTEIVPPDNLYQMPFKYIIPKIMAIRLSLDGVDKSTVTIEMQCAFKQFVDNRLLMMEVFPSAKKMALPKCRMWDPETNTDVMDVINKAAQLAFPNTIILQRGLTRPVKVTFVYSCNKFYIHLKSNEDELSHLMANIQAYCNSVTASYLEEPKIGQPCCAQFTHDGQWYRGLVMELNEDSAKVKYIDYGNEEDVTMQSLKTIEGGFLTCMRPQAIECCLNGYQNMTEDLDRDNKLEELILDQEFTMKVLDIVNGKSLVDLLDSTGRSVTTLLMEAMINQTKIQVITNGNLENISTKYGNANHIKKNVKPNDEGQWSPQDKSENRVERSENWRQSSRKRNGSMSNESTESWRQKNHKNDTEWQDNTSNESIRKGRPNSESKKSTNTNQRYDGKYRNNKNEFRNQNNSWNSPEKDKNHNTHSNAKNGHTEWNGKEASIGRNRSSRQDNDGFSNKDKNIPKNENWNADKSSYTWGENEEFQGVKKRTKNSNYSSNNSNNKNRSKNNNEEWGSKKNMFNGNDYSEKKSYRERNSYDSDSSHKKGKQDRTDGRPRYDRGDYKKKPSKKDNVYHMTEHEQTDGRNFNSKSDSKWTDKHNTRVSQNISYNNTTTVIDPAPNDATFQTLEVNGLQKVVLSWFHNPCMFFCQLMGFHENFNKLMGEIQEMYKDKPSSYAVEGAPAIALFPEDNVFYRSRILKIIGNQYKVYYVDFGNISVVDSVWPIDKKFMEIPMQAVPCGLGGIRSVGKDWPDPNAFVNYMQKDILDCEFLSYETDRYMVNLYSDNQDIKQQLVNDNLAKYVIPSPEFDINFLMGHTFRAMLQSVNDLSDFKMSLSSGIMLFCSAHNLAQATETFEEELKQKIGQVLVVYCDNIIGDRMEVTLYDHIGNKLNILNPDEGAFDSIETVCPYLLIKNKIEGFVPFVKETSIVIQPSECIDLIQSLLDELFEHYDNLPQETTLIPEEGFLYAVLSNDDSNWYRGRVISFDDDKVTVLYVDYGNSEDVPFANLRELDPKFFWWDRMAILVEVNIPTADLFEKQVTALVQYGELGLLGEILNVEDTSVIDKVQESKVANNDVEADTSNQTTQVTKTSENGHDIPLTVSSENKIANNVASSAHEEIPCEQHVDGTAVVISHIDSPSDFYIQLVDSQNAIGELQSKIQDQIDDMPVLENISIGGLCAAPYSVDQMWYRSQILDADEDITTVRFIDYGNTDVIDNKATQVKTLPAEFLALEEYARRCGLKIKPLDEEWSKATTDRFEELAYAENVTVQFINQDEKANYVELFSNGQNVKDCLIAENLAVLDECLALDAKLKGYISHMNSPSEFWVQLDGWCAELEWIAEQLSNAASFPDLEDFTPGSLCAAMFPDDEMWYRVRILSNTVAGLEVLFLDYGNSCVCGNLKQLPEHLVMAPPLALKCSLQKPEGLLNWSPEAAQKFADLSADGQTEFTLKKLTTGETSIVELYANNEEVSSKLLPITDDVCVTNIKSMDSFAASREGTISDERYRLEKIPGCEYNQDCLNKFVEINNEGKTCYGMELLADNYVRLYLNGNDIRNEFLTILKDKSCEPSAVTLDAPESEDLEISKVCDIPRTNEIEESSEVFETSVEKKNIEVSDEGAANLSETSKSEECREVKASEIYETPLEKKIHETTQEGASEVCETTQSEENPEESQIKTSEICETPLEKEIYGTIPEGIIEVCETLQSEKIHLVSGEDIFQVNEHPQEEEIHEELQVEASEVCESPREKEIYELSQQETANICSSPQTSTIDQTIQENTSKVCETFEVGVSEEKLQVCGTLQETEIHEESQKEAPEVHDTPLDKQIDQVIQKEFPVASDISQNEESHDVAPEKSSEVYDLSQIKGSFEESSVQTNGTNNLTDEFNMEGKTQEVTATQTEKLHDLVQKDEKSDTEKEETLAETTKICDNLNIEEIPVNCDAKDVEEEEQKVVLNSSIEGIHKITQEDISKDCDTTQVNEINDFIQEKVSELCDRLSEKVQEEIIEGDEKSPDSCDKLQTVAVSAEICDITKQTLSVDSNKVIEAHKSTAKLEFTETIMTSFSTPTVSEKKESVSKLSSTKVTPKVQESAGNTVGDSSELDG